MSELHLWIQALSDEGETILVSVEKTDKFDSSTLAVDCSDEEFRSIEASLCQALHRKTANEPLRLVLQTRGQKGFEASHAIVRRYDRWAEGAPITERERISREDPPLRWTLSLLEHCQKKQ